MSAYSTYTDKELVALLKAGKAAAFDALYWKYHQPIYKNILKLTKHDEAALDILQDVFAALWDKRDGLQEDQPIGNWLFRVSFNHSINFTKKRLKELLVMRSIDEQDDAEDVTDFNPSDVQFHLLSRALEKLSPQKRKVFELCKLEGKTYEETALEMSISKHTVKEYLASAMEFIKKFINDHPGYSETALFVLLANYL